MSGMGDSCKIGISSLGIFFQYDSICLDDGIFFAVVITAAKSPTLWILSVGFVSVSLWNICTSPITGAEVVTIAIWVEVGQYSSIICALYLNIWTRCCVACSFEQGTLHPSVDNKSERQQCRNSCLITHNNPSVLVLHNPIHAQFMEQS